MFLLVKSLTRVVTLKVPTSLHHRGSSVLISSWLHAMHDQPRRIISHQTHTEPEGWASFTSGTQCLWIHFALYQFTLQDKDGGRWNCPRNLMWCLNKSQCNQKGGCCLLMPSLSTPVNTQRIPSLNSDSICCFYQSVDKPLSRNVLLLLQRGSTIHAGDRHTAWILFLMLLPI